jgi:hypothetical protein
MKRSALTKAGTLLLAAVVVAVLAAPAVAAPIRVTGETPSFVHVLVAWLGAWLPGGPGGASPTAAWDALGPELDPSGSAATTAQEPAATPRTSRDASVRR